MTRNNDKSEIIGQRLKEEREYRGFSKQEVADYLGLSLKAMKEIEEGEKSIRSDDLENLAELYDLSVSQLCDDSDGVNTDRTIKVLERSNDELSEIDKNEIQRFAEYLKARHQRGDSND